MTQSTPMQAARQALQAGQKKEARLLLQQIVQEEPQNYQAWLWLASVAPTPRASLTYIERAAQLKPDDEAVQKARLWAESQLTTTPPAAESLPPPPPTPPQNRQTAVMWGGLAVGAVILVLLVGFAISRLNQRPTPSVAEAAVLSQQLAVTTSQPGTQAPTQPAPTLTPSPTAPRIQAKRIATEDENAQDPRPTWTLTPTPTNTPTPTPTPPPTFISQSGGSQPTTRPLGVAADERWIDVDLSQQTLYAYEGNELIFQTAISSGTWEHPTVTGQFRIWIKYASQTMDGALLGYDYYLEDVPYVMYFYEDYALHGTYWHSNFGTPMSHGCVNMETTDAQWVFSWAGVGTVVNVHQ